MLSMTKAMNVTMNGYQSQRSSGKKCGSSETNQCSNGFGNDSKIKSSSLTGPRSRKTGLLSSMWSIYDANGPFKHGSERDNEDDDSDDPPGMVDQHGHRRIVEDNVKTPVFSGDVVQFAKDVELWKKMTSAPKSRRGMRLLTRFPR